MVLPTLKNIPYSRMLRYH